MPHLCSYYWYKTIHTKAPFLLTTMFWTSWFQYLTWLASCVFLKHFIIKTIYSHHLFVIWFGENSRVSPWTAKKKHKVGKETSISHSTESWGSLVLSQKQIGFEWKFHEYCQPQNDVDCLKGGIPGGEKMTLLLTIKWM